MQAFPSLQDAVLFVLTQPVDVLHESFVQTFPSLQLGAGPGTQTPPLHASGVVHAFPSLQGAVLFALTQPVDVLHESLVHTLPSLQLGAGPPTQRPPEHVSAVVQAFPSLQDAVLFVLIQPVPGLHESSVQGLPSSQLVTHGKLQLVVVISSVQLLSVPVPKTVSSEDLNVQVPFGFSPWNTPNDSSGTSGVFNVPFEKVVSVTSLDAAKVFAENGTWFPGSALSSHCVPLKMLVAVPPLSVVSVMTVPAGEVSVISRSPGLVCVMNVWSRMRPI